MTVRGADAFIARLKSDQKTMPAKVGSIVKSEGAAMQEQTQRLVRVKTGNLRRSVDLKYRSDTSMVSAKVTANAYSKNDFNYGYIQEFGGSRISATNALRASFFAHATAAQKKLKGLV